MDAFSHSLITKHHFSWLFSQHSLLILLLLRLPYPLTPHTLSLRPHTHRLCWYTATNCKTFLYPVPSPFLQMDSPFKLPIHSDILQTPQTQGAHYCSPFCPSPTVTLLLHSVLKWMTSLMAWRCRCSSLWPPPPSLLTTSTSLSLSIVSSPKFVWRADHRQGSGARLPNFKLSFSLWKWWVWADFLFKLELHQL